MSDRVDDFQKSSECVHEEGAVDVPVIHYLKLNNSSQWSDYIIFSDKKSYDEEKIGVSFVGAIKKFCDEGIDNLVMVCTQGDETRVVIEARSRSLDTTRYNIQFELGITDYEITDYDCVEVLCPDLKDKAGSDISDEQALSLYL